MGYLYKAFISYKHRQLDKKIADRLQKMLENYKPPKGIGKQEKWKIFRDETELSSSSNLDESIKSALRSSEFLILICSEATRHSRWCMEEVEYFKKLHKGSNEKIIALTIDDNPAEIMPEAICTSIVSEINASGEKILTEKKTEPIAANIYDINLRKSFNKLKTEFLRIAAPLLSCGYDDLYNRERRRKIRRRLAFFAAVFSVVSLFSITSTYALLQITRLNSRLEKSNSELEAVNGELESTNNDLIMSNSKLEKKTHEAEENLIRAEENLEYANEQEAEAKKQENIAKNRATEAESARTAAEKAEREARESLRQVKEKNAELLLKNADISTNKASNLFSVGKDRIGAIELAVNSLPYEGDKDSLLPQTQKLLSDMMYNYSVTDSLRLDRLLQADGNISHFSLSDDNKLIMAYDDTNSVYVWETESGRLIFKKYIPYLYCAELCDDNSIVFVSGEGCRKFNFAENRTEWTASERLLTGGAFSRDRKYLAYYDDGGFIQKIDTNTGGISFSAETGFHFSSLDGLTEFRDGKHFVNAVFENDEYKVVTVNTATGETAEIYITPHTLKDIYSAGDLGIAVTEADTDCTVCRLFYFNGAVAAEVRLGKYYFRDADILGAFTKGEDVFVAVSCKDMFEKCVIYFVNAATKEAAYEFVPSKVLQLGVNETGLLLFCENGRIFSYNFEVLDIYDEMRGVDCATEMAVKTEAQIGAVTEKDKSQILLYKNYCDKDFEIIKTGDSYLSLIDTAGKYISGYDFGLKKIMVFDKSTKKNTLTVDCDLAYCQYGFFGKENIAVLNRNGELSAYGLGDGALKYSIDIPTDTENADDRKTWFLTAIKEKNLYAVYSLSGTVCILDDKGIRSTFKTDLSLLSKYSKITPDCTKMIIPYERYIDGFKNEIAVLELSSGKISVCEKSAPSFDNADFPKTEVSPDSLTAAVLFDEEIIILDTKTARIISEIAVERNSVREFVFTPDGSRLAVITASGRLSVYNIKDASEVKALRLSFESDDKDLLTLRVFEEINCIVAASSQCVYFVDCGGLEIISEATGLYHTYKCFDGESKSVVLAIYDPDNSDKYCLALFKYRSCEELMRQARALIER